MEDVENDGFKVLWGDLRKRLNDFRCNSLPKLGYGAFKSVVGTGGHRR